MKNIIKTLLFPCTIRRRRRRKVREKRKAPEQWGKRKHLPDHRINISQTSFDPILNTKSGLLKLPLELRLLIYKYVLAENPAIHLFVDFGHHYLTTRNGVQEKRLCHFPCKSPGGQPPQLSRQFGCYISCWSQRSAYAWMYPIPKNSLLLTCRQIYQEAQPVLYRENIFFVAEPSNFFWVADHFLRPQHLALIRHLRMDWRFASRHGRFYELPTTPLVPGDIKAWNKFWKTIETRMDLLSLDLYLAYYSLGSLGDRPVPAQLDAPWLEPMLRVKGLRDVKIRFFNLVDWQDAPTEFTAFAEELTRTMRSP